MHTYSRLRIVLFAIAAMLFPFYRATGDMPPINYISTTGRLPYRKIVVPTSKYYYVYGVNSQLHMVGVFAPKKNSGAKCIDLFDSSGSVLRSACLVPPSGQYVFIENAFVNQADMVAGIAQFNFYKDGKTSQSVFFRVLPDSTIDVVQKPANLDAFNEGHLTGLSPDGTVTGYYTRQGYVTTTTSVGFIAPVGGEAQILLPADSISSIIRGISESKLFGQSTKAHDGSRYGVADVGWIFDLATNTNQSVPEKLAGVFGISIDNFAHGTNYTSSAYESYASSLYDGNGIKSVLKYEQNQFTKRPIRKQGLELDVINSLTYDGFRLWEAADDFIVEKDAKVSRSLYCALSTRDGSTPTSPLLFEGGLVLFSGTWGIGNTQTHPVILAPAEKDTLKNYCMHAEFLLPSVVRKILRKENHCDTGPVLEEISPLVTNSCVPVVIRVFDGDENPIQNARIRMNVTNDNRRFVKQFRTDRRGEARVELTFTDKARSGGACYSTTFSITKPG